MSNIRVAVRVRPFSQNERKAGGKCIVEMQGSNTTLISPDDGSPRPFSFDHSFYSHDETASNFASQERLFLELGSEVLSNAFCGFNASVFAYGQTGSGKSYSMLGGTTAGSQGLIPRICQGLFQRIASNADANVTYKVEVSFMEIYNEKVRDLLDVRRGATRSLKVRNHIKTGPYVEGLSRCAVENYDDVAGIMEEGARSRTVASTNMNATSSRSHAIFTVYFTQSTHDPVNLSSSDLVSNINLVDLAGSERAKKTGATGVRLREGANINKSLSTLGAVINALADQQKKNKKGKKKGKKAAGTFIPYRDSVLTWLLRESLGGNSKTIMLAAISPSDAHYEETLSTLRYAERAKSIETNAVVNEDKNTKMIRELREEVDRLKKCVTSGGVPMQVASAAPIQELEEKTAEIEYLRNQLVQTEGLVDQLNVSWEEKLKATKDLIARKAKNVHPVLPATTACPSLVNLNEDPQLAECLVYQLKQGTTSVGLTGDVKLVGLHLSDEHCLIFNKDNQISIEPQGDGATFVNGEKITQLTDLRKGDRIILGTSHVFRLNNPYDRRKDSSSKNTAGHPKQPKDWSFALRELAVKQKLVPQGLERVSTPQKGGAKTRSQNPIVVSESRLDSVLDRLEQDRRQTLQLITETEDEQNAHLVQVENSEMLDEAEKNELKRITVQQTQSRLEDLRKRETYLLSMMEDQQKEYVELQEQQDRHQVEQATREEQVLQAITLANEANEHAHSAKRPLRFELHLRKDPLSQNSELLIEAINTDSGSTCHFAVDDFVDRVMMMRDADPVEDPFTFVEGQQTLLGSALVYLSPLYYLAPIEWQASIIDSSGKECGQLGITITATDETVAHLRSLPADSSQERYEEELGKSRLQFDVCIENASQLSVDSFGTLQCSFAFWDQTQSFSTGKVDEINGEDFVWFDYNEQITIERGGSDVVDYLKGGCLVFQVWADHIKKQVETVERTVESGTFFKLNVGVMEDGVVVPPRPVLKFRPGGKSRVLKLEATEFSSESGGVDEWISASLCDIVSVDRDDVAFPNSGGASEILLFKSQDPSHFQWPSDVALLSSPTPKGRRVKCTLKITLRVHGISKVVTVTKDILFRVSHAKNEDASPLTPDTRASTMELHVALRKTHQIDMKSTASNVLESHKHNAVAVNNVVRAEKLRQELELQRLNDSGHRRRSEFHLGLIENSMRKQRKIPSAITPSLMRQQSVLNVSVKESKTSVQMKGVLRKARKHQDRWKERYFVLSRPTLSWWNSANDCMMHKTPLGSVDLMDCELSITASEQKFKFVVNGFHRRNLMLQAATKAQFLDWQAAFSCYQRVVEPPAPLSRQLDFDKENNNESPTSVSAAEDDMFTLKRKLRMLEQERDEKDKEILALKNQTLEQAEKLVELPHKYENRIWSLEEQLEDKMLTLKKPVKDLVNLPTPSKTKSLTNEEWRAREKRLREAIAAHISQNSFMASEMSQTRDTLELELDSKKNQLRKSEAHCNLLHQQNRTLKMKLRMYEMKEDLSSVESEALKGFLDEAEEANRLRTELEAVKKSYFLSFAVSLKLNASLSGGCPNVNVHEMYEIAVDKGVPYDQWNGWISNQINRSMK